jgi:hypothetical protein
MPQAKIRLRSVASTRLKRFASTGTTVRPGDPPDAVKHSGNPASARPTHLIDQAPRAREPGWWTTYGIKNQGCIDVETEAAHISELALLVVPGLPQTVGYMRALFEAHRLPRTKRRLENDIRVRRIRQERLTGPDPLRLHAIIDEAALRKDVGGPEVMREQRQLRGGGVRGVGGRRAGLEEPGCRNARVPRCSVVVLPPALGLLTGRVPP